MVRMSRWHWRAFLTGGGSAFWVLAYGLFYMVSRLSLSSVQSALLYLGYLFLIALFDFLVTGTYRSRSRRLIAHSAARTGTIGFLAAYWAVRRLYSAIRVD